MLQVGEEEEDFNIETSATQVPCKVKYIFDSYYFHFLGILWKKNANKKKTSLEINVVCSLLMSVV